MYDRGRFGPNCIIEITGRQKPRVVLFGLPVALDGILLLSGAISGASPLCSLSILLDLV